MKLQNIVNYVFGRREYYHEFMDDVMMDIQYSSNKLYGVGLEGGLLSCLSLFWF